MRSFDELLQIMDRLLADDGCPWDKEQTHESLRKYLIEECYEVVDAVDKKDMSALKEELGDVLLQIVFHAKLAERGGHFTMDDVARAINQKLISRHTHIFGQDTAVTADEVEKFWENNKKKEKKYESLSDEMDAVPKALPSLIRAEKVWKKTDKSVRAAETTEALTVEIIEHLKNLSHDAGAIGEILFKLVKISAILEINAEFSLTNTIEAFINSGRKIL